MQELLAETEEALLRAKGTSDTALAAQLTKDAVAVRRAHCHALSLLRCHAESAAVNAAVAAGDYGTARQCCGFVVAFLEVALAHVPWHPSLSLERLQLAGEGGLSWQRSGLLRLAGEAG